MTKKHKGHKGSKGGKKKGAVRKSFGNAPKSKVKLSQLKIVDFAGRPEMEKVRLRYAYKNSFTTTGGNISNFQIKMNSLYRPVIGGPADVAQGSAALYALYTNAMVYSSKINIKFWAGSAGDDEPVRFAVVPCTAAQATALSAFSDLMTVADVPNARSRVFSPGDKLPSLNHTAYVPQIYKGVNQTLEEMMVTNTYAAAVNSDPSNLCYWLVAIQNFAGNTNNNIQYEITVEYDCVFYNPIQSNIVQ